jgi:hypothetical protein
MFPSGGLVGVRPRFEFRCFAASQCARAARNPRPPAAPCAFRGRVSTCTRWPAMPTPGRRPRPVARYAGARPWRRCAALPSAAPQRRADAHVRGGSSLYAGAGQRPSARRARCSTAAAAATPPPPPLRRRRRRRAATPPLPLPPHRRRSRYRRCRHAAAATRRRRRAAPPLRRAGLAPGRSGQEGDLGRASPVRSRCNRESVPPS